MKIQEKQQAIALRKGGYSYQEIQTVLSVSPSSLSRWLRSIPLSASHHAHLESKQSVGRRRLLVLNEQRHQQAVLEESRLREESARAIGGLTRRELQLIGTALYWAEGCKGHLTSVVEFVNADPDMIALMMRWFRECCGVPEHKFRARVQLYDIDRQAEIEHFWSNLTGIAPSHFTQPILKLSPSSQRKQGNTLPFGTLHIRIADVRLLRIVRGWIAGLSLAPSSSPA